ncbi:MAG: TonB-dependent receptor [Bryobacterales bacterium]|nr:TonB-dependent receptor [Bryobacterales bacterium]
MIEYFKFHSERVASSRYTHVHFLLALTLLLSLVLSPVGAQERVGSIIGTVTDPSGAAVPGATISISAATITTSVDLQSDASGNFQALQLPAGKYSVTVSSPGFAGMRKPDIPVELGRSTRADFVLEIGQVSEQVVVTSDAILVDSQSSASAVIVDRQFSDLLPKGRSFYDLIAIAPGARPESKTGGVQVDGASGSENTFYVDGVEVTNIQTGVLSSQNRIPVEMVEQTQIKNGVMEAQYGGAMGGVINAVMRGGTNEYHGQVGFYFDNDSMKARPRPSLRVSPFDDDVAEYFDNKQDDYTTKNPIFTIGGPIVKNKLFFFTGYMPVFTNTARNVTFNVDDSTRPFRSTERQHYLTNKLDYNVFSKLRVAGSWTWNPYVKRGVLPSRQGTDDPDSGWQGQGEYNAGNLFSYSADYMPTPKMVVSFRGGYHFNNHKTNYGISSDTSVYYSNVPPASLGVPQSLIAPAGYVTYAPGATFFDANKRHNYNFDVSYVADFLGQHTFKGGWQMNELGNEVNTQTWASGYYRYYWGLNYRCVTSQCSGQQTGTFGYYRYREIATRGDVSSNNQSLFFQDTWRVNRMLTLNLGVRTEREFLPSFSSDKTIPSRAIEFPWQDKFSPRLGFAFDPGGNGKTRIYASFGYFYDIMKYELPRGSFGGDTWNDYFFSLDDFNWVNSNQGIPSDPTNIRGRFFETINWRIPSNDPNDNTIDPNLKPMKQRMFDFGMERMVGSNLVASARYTNRRLIRTIEDVGTLGPDGEIYYIGNPGFGITADPKTWDSGFPTTPKARRDYDAVEFRLDKRYSDRYQFAASYTWSRQFGNYSGLASSDEDGRTSPNVNRYFDLPWIYYTEQGRYAEGRLATDRPHTVKLFGGYVLGNKLGATTFAPNILLYSGTPLTTEVDAISTTPVVPYGRGDLGRTPVFFNTDFNVMHEFKTIGSKENLRVRLELTIFNLFNSATVTNRNIQLQNSNDGQLQFDHEADIFQGFNARNLMREQDMRINPIYGLASGFQQPRGLRLQMSFYF